MIRKKTDVLMTGNPCFAQAKIDLYANSCMPSFFAHISS